MICTSVDLPPSAAMPYPSAVKLSLEMPRSNKKIELKFGAFDELQTDSLRDWRMRSHQERLDLFLELLKLWRPNAPGLSRTFAITSIPRR